MPAPCPTAGLGMSPCPDRHQDPNQFWALGKLQFGATSPAHRWWIQGPGSSSEGAGRDCGGLTLPAMTEVKLARRSQEEENSPGVEGVRTREGVR